MQVNTCMSSGDYQARNQVFVTLRIRTDDQDWRRVASADWIACQMREGVAGMSRCRTPSGVSAFITAFMMVAGAAMAPA